MLCKKILGATLGAMLLLAAPASAEIRTVEGVGSYELSEEMGDSFQAAQEMARRDALRMASEQAGVFIGSLSDVRDSVLTRDEIQTIAASILKVKSEDITPEVGENGAISYRCRVTAEVDTDLVTRDMLSDRQALHAAVQRGRELAEESERAGQELGQLKNGYSQAAEEEKPKLRKQMKVNAQKLEALKYFEQGNKLTAQDDYNGAA